MKNWVKSPQDFAAFFLEWAVPVEIKMDHVTWLWMQLGHLKSGTEDAAVQTKPFKFWWKPKPNEIIGLRLWKQMNGKAAPPSKN